MRVEVRRALCDLYERMGYDAASAVGVWQQEEAPRPLDDEWVYDEDS